MKSALKTLAFAYLAWWVLFLNFMVVAGLPYAISEDSWIVWAAVVVVVLAVDAVFFRRVAKD